MNYIKDLNIPDIQNLQDNRKIAIHKVGIKDLKYPIDVEIGKNNLSTIGTFDMYVNLPPTVKGTHMSRFIEVIEEFENKVTFDSFKSLLFHMIKRLESTSGFLDLKFPYFIKKAAPVSKVESLMDYEVSLNASLVDGKDSFKIKVIVPVKSLCPCSKEISEYGAHNQRSHITIEIEVLEEVKVDEIINIAENQASSQLYSILKRPDEKYITEKAYENPKFVEDLVRDIAFFLKGDSRIKSFSVESENFESIHNHSAYAMVTS